MNNKSLNENLDNLVKKNKRMATISLCGLFFVFFFSVILFFYSDTIANFSETDELKNYFESLQSDFDTVRSRRDLILKKIDQYRSEIEKDREILNNDSIMNRYIENRHPRGLDTSTRIKEEVRLKVEKKLEIEQIDNSLKKYETELKEINQTYNELSNRIEELRTSQIEKLKAQKGGATEKIIASAITRTGAIGLSCFMMQILLSFYKFFLKVSNYYEEKKMIANQIINQELLLEYSKTISTEHISFGNNPQPPIERIIDLIKITK